MQLVERPGAVGRGPLGVTRRGAPHGFGSLLESIGGVTQVLPRVFARQALELARQFLRLLGDLPLVSSASAASTGLLLSRLGTLALDLLLLASRQLRESLQRLVDFVVELFLLAALHRLVLVAHLVELLAEHLHELLHVAACRTTTTATTSAHRHLHVAERGLDTLQLLQGPLLRGQRRLGVLHLEVLARGNHLVDGEREVLGNLGKLRSATKAASELESLIANLSL